jgi:hypothetical protein
MRGMVQATVRSGIPYIPVHADNIGREAGNLATLVIPNMGILTTSQIESIGKFIKNGGSIFATGETSLYNEWGDPLEDYALSNFFGVQKIVQPDRQKREVAVRKASETLHTYLRLSPELRAGVNGPVNGKEPKGGGLRHVTLKGFEETDILSFGGFLEPHRIRQGSLIPLTFIPEFPIYPPETAWMRTPKTDTPGLIINTLPSGSRIAFMPADLDRQYGRYNLPDHGNLLANIIRWTAKDNIPLNIECAGLLDCNLYRQEGRLILHIANLTSAGTWRQPVDEFIPVGPVKVKVQLSDGVAGNELKLLVSGQTQPLKPENGSVTFTIDSIKDHEVAVIL